ncbi:MAG: hypothetical protein EHM79_21375 [Geobacter sp.]|nr:MAG: hypothetical protein EHM79_21375 [Geobacter sp.]
MEYEILNNVKHVLNDWNPPGEYASKIHDLNEYETEANDILFYIDFKTTSKKTLEVKKINKLVKDVLKQAFNINLTNEECREPAEKIYQILYEKSL